MSPMASPDKRRRGSKKGSFIGGSFFGVE